MKDVSNATAYALLLPQLMKAGREVGYAIAVHGSMARDRGTQRECRELLAEYVTNPKPPPQSRWGSGPYTILRIITTHIVTVRRPRASLSSSHETTGEKT